jgi:predicted TIM-barrel fold metal-dependent hydrolase
MRRSPSILALVALGCIVVASCDAIGSRTAGTADAQESTELRSREGLVIPVTPRAPAGVAEGGTWVPPMPPMEAVAPPPGWEPDGLEQPPMPYILLRLPRTNIYRAKYPAVDVHVHAGGLTTPEAYEQLIATMDSTGIGVIWNMSAGIGERLDAILTAGEPYRDRVVNCMNISGGGADSLSVPGWADRFAAEMERAFQAGALCMGEVSKSIGQGWQNPDGTFIQADDPRLDPIWEMAARYGIPVVIHTSDSVGRFYPIGPLNERYEAGLWHQPGETNLYDSGPPREVIEEARENLMRRHPNTRFIWAHMAMLYYDPQKLAAFLDEFPNAVVEISAAVQDLGRAPRLWRDFFISYQDRIIFGSDGGPGRGVDEFWVPHWRFLETFDEHFYHPAQIRTPGGSPGHGRYNIYGLGLPDDVLRKVYYENVLRHLPALRESIERQLAERQ